MRQFLLHSDVFAETWASRPIPEPTSLLLLAAGVAPLLALGLRTRRLARR